MIEMTDERKESQIVDVSQRHKRNSNVVFETCIWELGGNKIKINLKQANREDLLNVAIALLSSLLVYLYTTVVPTPDTRSTPLVERPLSRDAELHRRILKSKMRGPMLPCFPYAFCWTVPRPWVKDVLYESAVYLQDACHCCFGAHSYVVTLRVITPCSLVCKWLLIVFQGLYLEHARETV